MSEHNEPRASRVGELTMARTLSIRPTQMSAGLRAAKTRLAKLRAKSPEKQDKYLLNRPIPVVVGPDQALYMIDRHHMALAICWLGRPSALCRIEADLSDLSADAFWTAMSDRRWARARDENGHERPFSEMPQSVMELRDDHYRSLAGAARRQGAYAKSPRPYSEFSWADYFRTRVPLERVLLSFEEALASAFDLARAPEARDLPGYQEGMAPARPCPSMVATRAIERRQQDQCATLDASLLDITAPARSLPSPAR